MTSKCRQDFTVKKCALTVCTGGALTRSTSSSHLFLLASARRSFCNRVSFGARAGSSNSASSEPVTRARRSLDAQNSRGGLDGVQGSSRTHAPVNTSGAPSSSSSLSGANVIRSDENLTAMLPGAAAAGDVPYFIVSMPLQSASERLQARLTRLYICRRLF